MQTGGIAVEFSQVGSDGLPLLPTASTRNVQCAEEFSCYAIQTDLYLSATQSTGYTGRKRTWCLVAKMHSLQFDVIAVVNIGDVHAHFVVLLSFHSFRERHRFSLHLTIGVELVNGFYTFVSRHDGGKTTIRIVFEFLYGYAASETATIW